MRLLPPRRMRVLHLGKYYPPFRGGIETHLANLCAGLRDRVDLAVIVANDRATGSQEWIDGVPVRRVGRWGQILSTPITPGLYSALLMHRPVDVIHLHHPNPMAMMAYLAIQPEGKLVVSYHSDIVRQKSLLRFYEVYLHHLLSRADTIIVGSQRYADTSPVLRPHLDKVEAVPYGIDLHPFTLHERLRNRAAWWRRRLGERIVLAVGRLVYYKGFDVLIRAMKQIDAHLALVGDGALDKTLRRLVGRLGLDSRVVFLGNLADFDVRALYHASDVFVLPSVARSEAFGIVQAEAMASGTPVVATNLDSGVPYVNQHGVTGLNAQPGSVDGLAAAINLLLGDPELRRRCGEAGRRRAHAEFGRDLMTDRIHGIYERLCS